nr:cycloserine biosynthesis protein dcsg [Quercus suber]
MPPVNVSEPRPLVFLATCRDLPAGEPGCARLDAALEQLNIDVKWVVWDDPSIDWAQADLIAARSIWDYQTKMSLFRTWIVELGPKLLHGGSVMHWNASKAYLLELAAAGVEIVPTIYATTVAEVHVALQRMSKSVVKPVIGASGIGVQIVNGAPCDEWAPEMDGPWVVQPFVEDVLTEGEIAVYIIDGYATAQLTKKVAKGEFRVHEGYGGQYARTPLSSEAEGIARKTYDLAEKILGVKLRYARIDLLRYKGRLAVSELEITEPSLEFDTIPDHAESFAAMIRNVLDIGSRNLG